MKKNKLLLIIIAVAVLVAGYIQYLNRDLFAETPFKRQLDFEFLSYVLTDTQDNIYTIDKSRKRVMKINDSGGLIYVLGPDKRYKESVSLYAGLSVDNNGFLYVLSTILDARGHFVDAEEIARYNPEGKFDKVIYRVDYAEGNRPVRTGLLQSLKVEGDSVYFYSVGEHNLLLNRLSLDGREVENIVTIALPRDMYLAEVTGHDPEVTYCSTKGGEIYRIDSSGGFALVYAEEPNTNTYKSIPKNLVIDPGNRICFADVGRSEINRLNARGAGEDFTTLLSSGILRAQGFDIPFNNLSNIALTRDGSLLIGAADQIIVAWPEGKVRQVINQVKYPLHMTACKILFWLLPLLTAALLLSAAKILYVGIMRRRVSLMTKQLTVFIPLIAFSMSLVAGFVYFKFADKMENELFAKMTILANMGSKVVAGEQLERITRPGHFMNADYRAVRERAHSMFEENTDISTEEFYGAVYKMEDGQLFMIMAYDDSVSPFYPIDVEGEEYARVLETGRIVTGKSSDLDGNWMYALGPLYNASGQIVGVYETGMDLDGFSQYKQGLLINLGKGIALAITVIIIVFFIMTFLMLKSIGVLRDGAHEVASGNWDATVSVKTRDEVGDLSEEFNKMAEYIRKYISEINLLKESYMRFVPHQFVSFLDKKCILDVQLGDQVKQQMSVLFVNIRSFFLIAENLTPEESFDFINSFLKRIGPVIRNNEGFIGKYLGAGIMAVFPGAPEDALKAAVEMRRELDLYNAYRSKVGQESIDIGTGIHRGPLMLGIIGEEKRLEGAVISDTVNLAATIERLTERFGTSILITEDMLNENVAQQYHYRLLGLVQVENKEEPVKIYDVYQCEPNIIRRLKQETKEAFEEGVMLYQEGRFYDSRGKFVEVIRNNHWDEAAKIYFFLCDEYFKKGAPEDWKGTLTA